MIGAASDERNYNQIELALGQNGCDPQGHSGAVIREPAEVVALQSLTAHRMTVRNFEAKRSSAGTDWLYFRDKCRPTSDSSGPARMVPGSIFPSAKKGTYSFMKTGCRAPILGATSLLRYYRGATVKHAPILW